MEIENSASGKQEKMIVISAPSGAGKSTLVGALLDRIPELEFSVSACSRKQRGKEQEGKDYYFMTPVVFREKIKAGEFIEWEEVYPGHFYGTLKSELYRIWKKKHPVIFDVDVLGGLNIKKQYPSQTLSIFIRPPSIAELERRLINRSTDSPEDIQKRIGKARREITYADQFDVEIVNDLLDKARSTLYSVVSSFLNNK